MKYTTNFKFKKPELADSPPDISELNSNWDMIDKELNALEHIAMVDGSPKGVFDTLHSLKTTYPAGTDGIFVTTEDGKWYFWDGSAWVSGGVYQAAQTQIDLTAFPKKIGYLGLNGSISGPNDTNWLYTDPAIPFRQNIKITFSIYGHSNVGSINFYDSVGAFISNWHGSASTTTLESGTIVSPAGTASLRLSYFNPDIPPSKISTAIAHFPLEDRIYANELDIADIKQKFLINKITNPTMTLDADNDGVADGWTIYTDGGVTATRSISSGGQKIVITASTSATGAGAAVYQEVQAKEGDIITFSIEYKNENYSLGFKNFNMIWFLNSSNATISTDNLIVSAIDNWTKIEKSYIVPSGAVCIRIYAMARSTGTGIVGTSFFRNAYIYKGSDLQEINDRLSILGSKQDIPSMHPPKIYTVCNDIKTGNKGRNRNCSAAIYLDHMFAGLTSELDIYFKSRKDSRMTFTAPMEVVDANETVPAVVLNGGKNINIDNISDVITGSSIVDKPINVLHISTLNSVTKNSTPKVLCIGDSITYAEQAFIADDDFTQNHAYHLMCKEMFERDKIDNDGVGYDLLFLGQYKKEKNMSYNGSNYSIITHHEGIRGISLSAYLNGGVAAFKSAKTGLFSIDAWLSQYRTMDDNGIRLKLGNGTGSLITNGNINDIDVCTPTHVLVMLGTNGSGTQSQYQQMIDIIKSEHPDTQIALAISDTGGTYFPSRHPNVDSKAWFWNDIGGKHTQNYGIQSLFQTVFATSSNEDNGIYVLPFFYVTPPGKSCAMRCSDMPDSGIALMTEYSRFNAVYGWGPSVHINGIGHYNWAYQLYAWLKYTIAKKL